MLALPPIIGHRGACAYAPENTLASFAKAADLGCAMVEFDVRLTADGVPIVFHDGTLQRCTNGRGPVGTRTLAELKRLDAGQGETIPTLAEVLTLCLDRGMAVNIELKPDHGAGKTTARAALDLAASLWPSDRPAPLISSFDREALSTAQQVMPSWPRGLLVERVPAQWHQLAEQFGCSAVCAHHRWLPASTVASVTGAGLALLAYTVNRPGRAKALWKRGISAIFCDAPDRLL